MNQGLELTDVCRIVAGETHLADLSLSFEPGSFTVLLGRTSAGKTSLLRVLAGLDRVSSGKLSWQGVDVTAKDVRSRNVAMVYQQFVNYPSFTVYDNIASPLRLEKSISRDALDRRVREAAALLRIDDMLDRLPAELSGGQQQRTAIARAIVKRAPLVLLDEPLANLDYKLREELRSELRTVFRDNPAIVVYATTEPSEALLFGGRTAVLDEGRLLQLGPALDVYRAPISERVGQVFSDPQMNVLDLEVTPTRELRSDGVLTFPRTPSLEELAPGRYRLGIRASHVCLARAAELDLHLRAAVTAQEISGSQTVLHVSCGGVALTAQLAGVQRFPIDSSVDLFVSPRHLFVFDQTGRRVAAAEGASRGAH
jgi:glycerol transport system ATP-binding protein